MLSERIFSSGKKILHFESVSVFPRGGLWHNGPPKYATGSESNAVNVRGRNKIV